MNSGSVSSDSSGCIILIMKIGSRNGFCSVGAKYLNRMGPRFDTVPLSADIINLNASKEKLFCAVGPEKNLRFA